MSRFIDLTGERFGRLVVVSRAENDKQGRSRFQCRCDCGLTAIVKSTHLKGGATKSCGCLYVEVAARLKKEKPTPDAAYEQYHKHRKSALELSEMWQVSVTTVYRWLHQYGVQTRDSKTAMRLSQKNKISARGNLKGFSLEQRTKSVRAAVASGGFKIGVVRSAKVRTSRAMVSLKCPVCDAAYKTRKSDARKYKTCSSACGFVMQSRTKAANREWNRKHAYIPRGAAR